MATAFASSVFPVPGGPNSSTPFHGSRTPVKYVGQICGSTTASCSSFLHVSSPAISLKCTLGAASRISRSSCSISSRSGCRWFAGTLQKRGRGCAPNVKALPAAPPPPPPPPLSSAAAATAPGGGACIFTLVARSTSTPQAVFKVAFICASWASPAGMLSPYATIFRSATSYRSSAAAGLERNKASPRCNSDSSSRYAQQKVLQVFTAGANTGCVALGRLCKRRRVVSCPFPSPTVRPSN